MAFFRQSDRRHFCFSANRVTQPVRFKQVERGATLWLAPAFVRCRRATAVTAPARESRCSRDGFAGSVFHWTEQRTDVGAAAHIQRRHHLSSLNIPTYIHARGNLNNSCLSEWNLKGYFTDSIINQTFLLIIITGLVLIIASLVINFKGGNKHI